MRVADDCWYSVPDTHMLDEIEQGETTGSMHGLVYKTGDPSEGFSAPSV